METSSLAYKLLIFFLPSASYSYLPLPSWHRKVSYVVRLVLLALSKLWELGGLEGYFFTSVWLLVFATIILLYSLKWHHANNTRLMMALLDKLSHHWFNLCCCSRWMFDLLHGTGIGTIAEIAACKSRVNNFISLFSYRTQVWCSHNIVARQSVCFSAIM